MNLLIAFVILLCLGISELRDPELAQHLGQRLTLLTVIALLVPGAAIFQTAIIGRRCRNQTIDEVARQRILNRLSISHSAVWLMASLAIVWGLRWPDIVRVNWHCDRWPLLDDIMILAPILISLFFSWAIFYDVKRLLDRSIAGQNSHANGYSFRLDLAERFQFVGLRFRVYVLMSLIPILATLLVRDAADFTQRLPQILQNVSLIAGSAIVIATFPLLMLLAWRHGPIEDPELRDRLFRCCRNLNLGVWTIRAWHTGSQIINAVVAGIVPGLRVIVISDAMLEEFPPRELLAVVRHEAGHIRMSHMPIRMFFLLFPLILAAIDQVNGAFIANTVTQKFESLNLTSTHALVASAIAYVAYLVPTLTWLSRQMEFEADWFSVMSDQTDDPKTIGNANQREDLAIYDSMTLAIARLAAHSPEQFERRTLMHPSLKERMQRTSRLADHRISNEQLVRITARRVWFIRIAVAIFSVAFLIRTAIFA
jgi:STE24 endopeptidase